MNRIRLLPENVANQIAAGEVVERPSSVVKELVENALDAKATAIHVEVQAGGRSLIRITDDGIGMSKDDALMCLERHATSKIQRAEDLASIRTMGFRGEALPSIASVSRFTLTTREREGDAVDGTQVIINGGKILEVKAAGCAPGTSIEVRQLFYNLPARRKFLRAEETERAHIQHYVTLAALARPDVAFTLVHNGRLLWQYPAVTGDSKLSALGERLRALYGGDLELLEVDFTGHLAPAGEVMEDEPVVDSTVRLWGFIGAPGVSRSTREDQNVFVNQRPVENRGLNHALMEGYHNALMKGRFPVCCLFLEVDPAEVDVNIHPAKREVKFHRERNVRQLVTKAIRETLLRYHTGIGQVAEVKTAPTAPVIPQAEQRHLALPTTLELQSPPKLSVPVPSKPIADWPIERSVAGVQKAQAPLPEQRVVPVEPVRPAEPIAPLITPLASAPQPALPSGQPTGPRPLLSVPLRLVGVIGRLYVVLESDKGLVLLDQHAAHERILYEQMLQRLESGPAPSQRLLLPETVELPPRDAQFVRDQLTTLNKLGVGLSEFGDKTFLLDSLPPFVKVKDTRRFALELVDAMKSAGQSINTMRLGEDMIAKTVCRHAVKANDPLREAELQNLVEDLRRCTMPYTCPHGRPTLIEMSYKELEKKFGRTQ
ncbi:MAG TPA: DNA mismatch repair endonuclease MutL [Verrucomicrobiae bacterium]